MNRSKRKTAPDPGNAAGTADKKIPDATQDNLHYLAFTNNAQANIISVIKSGQIIAANKAACKLLGYTEKELMSRNRAAIFDLAEESFKQMLEERAESGQSIALVTALTKKGKSISCEISSAVFLDEGIEKAITAISDRSKSIRDQERLDAKNEKAVAADILLAQSAQKKLDKINKKTVAGDILAAQSKSDARLAANNEWIKYIAKTSYDVMWDWDITTGEIYVGDSIREVFGYKVPDNTAGFDDFSNCLLPADKKNVQQRLRRTLASGSKSWKDTFLFRRRDRSVAITTIRASIVRDEEGKAVRLIGALHDISRLQELEDQLKKQEDDSIKFLLSARFSLDVIWDWKMTTDEIFIGEGFGELFGYQIEQNKGSIADWGNHLHPDDRDMVKKGLGTALASSAAYWQETYRLVRADGSFARVFDRASIFRRADGTAYRMIGVMQDISRHKENTRARLSQTGDKKTQLVEQVKDLLINLIQYSDERLHINVSAYISAALGYDYTYLSQIFSKAEGMSIRTFIINQRLERAKELLHQGMNLTEIAYSLHYSSVAHLSNQFKQVIGISPSQFMKNRQKQEAEVS